MALFPMWLDGLPSEMVQKAEDELGETEDTKTQALKDLRRFINAEADFRPLMDEAFLLKFLRARKFNAEKAFHVLRNYYTFKVRYSKLITDFKPSELKKVLDMNIITALPSRLADGSAVALLRAGHFDVSAASPYELFATCLMGAEVGIDMEATQVCGANMVLDMDNFGLRLMSHFASPTFLFRMVRLVQDCVPCRIKSIHVINEPFFANVVFNVLRQFLSEKMKSRLHFHGRNLKSFHKEIPPENLPEELGGKLGPMDNSELMQQVLNREAQFERMNKYGFQDKRAHFIRKNSSRAIGLFL